MDPDLEKIKQSVNIGTFIEFLGKTGTFLSSQGDTFIAFVILIIVILPFKGPAIIKRLKFIKKSEKNKKHDINTANKK